jgi:hypothetical protein
MIQAELELLNAQYIVEQDIRFIKHINKSSNLQSFN